MVQNKAEDVLELDYEEESIDEEATDKLKIMDKPTEDSREKSLDKKSEKVEQTEDKSKWKNLWISGLDRSMKANDLKAAFEPFGKGKVHSRQISPKNSATVKYQKRLKFQWNLENLS